MVIFDLVHAYQPFHPPDFVPSWVEANLREIFIPLSKAAKKGLVKRGVQLQGWTIDAWLASPEPVKSLAKEFLANLSAAARAGHISLGASAYSHPILPLLKNDQLVLDQIRADVEVVEEHLGKPTWFFYPEASVDKRTLTLIKKDFPQLITALPDRALGKQRFSGLVKIKHGDGSFQKSAVFNSVFKDLFMNAPKYKKRSDLAPDELDWQKAIEAADSGDSFSHLINTLNKQDTVILARDWENYSFKYGFAEYGEGAVEVKALYELRESFELLDKVDWEGVSEILLAEIQASSWDERRSIPSDPYPAWAPTRGGWTWRKLDRATQKIVSSWLAFLDEFDKAYEPDFPKESLIVLASDVPWHFINYASWWRAKSKKEAWSNPGHSFELTQKAILPIVKNLGIDSLTEAAENLLADIEKFMMEKHGP